METVDIVVAVLMAIGLFFAFIGTLGILRMPDVFGRLQASTCISTMGTIFVILASIVYVVANGMSGSVVVKLVFILLFVLGTNPVSDHALCKGAYRSVKPNPEPIIDDFKEEIANALEGYSAQIDALKAEMDEATRNADAMKDSIAGLKNRFVTVDASDRCSVCGLGLLVRQFYVFPCQHTFHADCLISQVSQMSLERS